MTFLSSHVGFSLIIWKSITKTCLISHFNLAYPYPNTQTEIRDEHWLILEMTMYKNKEYEQKDDICYVICFSVNSKTEHYKIVCFNIDTIFSLVIKWIGRCTGLASQRNVKRQRSCFRCNNNTCFKTMVLTHDNDKWWVHVLWWKCTISMLYMIHTYQHTILFFGPPETQQILSSFEGRNEPMTFAVYAITHEE